MLNERKKPGVGFWCTFGVATVLLLYPLSFGPACWVVSYLDRRSAEDWLSFVYRPVIRAAFASWDDAGDSEGILFSALMSYADLAAKNPSRFTLDYDGTKQAGIWFGPVFEMKK